MSTQRPTPSLQPIAEAPREEESKGLMQSMVGKDEAVDAKSIEVAPTIDEV